MARCQSCGKRNQTGHSRSHSNIASKRKFKVNLQSKKIEGKKKLVCTRCIKTMTKVS
ncbi:MAG TPA: 50S ribosomal protein L28 [Candidatus Moranbacteria bacterium]|nr:50S ribosomal protein L28 [Candidatus Moranbacteria bacterium]